MRSKRLKKIRTRHRPFEIFIKTVLIFYIAFFSVSYLTSGTSAFFSSYEEINPVITAGTWESEQLGESKLAFINEKGNQMVKQCPAKFKVELKNIGVGDMKADVTYDVYYVKNGNPEKHGKKLALDKEGVIKPLKKGETATLTYETDVSGVYVFSVYQQDDPIWSKWMKVDCRSSKAVPTEKKTEKPANNKVEDKQSPATNEPAESETEAKTVNLEGNKTQSESTSDQSENIQIDEDQDQSDDQDASEEGAESVEDS